MTRRFLTALLFLAILVTPRVSRAQYKLSYEFEDGQAPPFHDEVTNLAANSLIGNGIGVNLGVTGLAGDQALGFQNGGNWYAHTAGGISLGAPETITVELWAYAHAPVNSGLIYKAFTALGHPTIAITLFPNNGKFDATFNVGGKFGVACAYSTFDYYPGLIPADTWVHYTMVYDGLLLRAFIDGAELGSPSNANPANVCKAGPLADDATQPLVVGAQADKTGAVQYPFTSGLVDDIRIFAGRNAPSECPTLPVAMADSRAGFCIDKVPATETAYGDAINRCAARSATVCTYSQLYTAAYSAVPAITMVTGNPGVLAPLQYRSGDLVFELGTNQLWFSGWDNMNQVADQLRPPNVAGPAGGPPGWTGKLAGFNPQNQQIGNGPNTVGTEPLAEPYFCCIPK